MARLAVPGSQLPISLSSSSSVPFQFSIPPPASFSVAISVSRFKSGRASVSLPATALPPSTTPHMDGTAGPTLFPLHRCKTLHLVRHAEAIHNVEGEKDHKAYLSQELFDAHLTPLGWQQVDSLRKHVHGSGLAKRIELVIASPLLRTMQTAVGVFGGEEYADGMESPPLMVAKAGNSDHSAISSIDCPPFLAVELCREHVENEELDRFSLLLPGKQMDLISTVADSSEKPILLILNGGGPIDISFAKDDDRIAGIIWVGYPGEAGGKALAELIFGEFNPGGRLPMTWYPESFTNVPMTDMSMRPDPSRGYPGRTYRFYTGDNVYRFGYGLSYTNYTYSFLSVPDKLSLLGASQMHRYNVRTLSQRRDDHEYVPVDELESCDALRFHTKILVTNNGDMDGSHVLM